jgi:hypothetical protein
MAVRTILYLLTENLVDCSFFCSVRQAVKSSPFHGEVTGSNPVRSTIIARWCNGNTTGFGPVILGSNPSRVTSSFRKIGRVVECTGLENQRTARYRRFESYIFRKSYIFKYPYCSVGLSKIQFLLQEVECLSEVTQNGLVVQLVRMQACHA